MGLNALLFRRGNTADEKRAAEFARRYSELSERLDEIRTSYDLVTDESVIDALIYEENAVLCRMGALYRQARAEGITIDYRLQMKDHS